MIFCSLMNASAFVCVRFQHVTTASSGISNQVGFNPLFTGLCVPPSPPFGPRIVPVTVRCRNHVFRLFRVLHFQAICSSISDFMWTCFVIMLVMGISQKDSSTLCIKVYLSSWSPSAMSSSSFSSLQSYIIIIIGIVISIYCKKYDDNSNDNSIWK